MGGWGSSLPVAIGGFACIGEALPYFLHPSSSPCKLYLSGRRRRHGRRADSSVSQLDKYGRPLSEGGSSHDRCSRGHGAHVFERLKVLLMNL